jgi:hypothetical protein
MQIVSPIVPEPQPIPEEVWRRAKGNQRFRDRKFVESGRERARLIDAGIITPAKKKDRKKAK